MKWIKIIDELSDAGFTQAQIAENSGMLQQSVSLLRSGKTSNPRYDHGVKLDAFYKRVKRRIAKSEKRKRHAIVAGK